MNKSDIAIIRELAKQYAQLAFSDKNNENMQRMRNVNALRRCRPAVYIHELPWHELNIDNQLTLRCEDPVLQEFERHFRCSLLQDKYFPCDMVYQPCAPVWKKKNDSGIGMDAIDHVVATNEQNHIVSHEYADQLQTAEDLEKLHPPVITYDKEDTERRLAMAQEVFDGILPVKLTGHVMHWNPWDDIARFRGVQPLLMDLAMRPEFMHDIMKKMLIIAESTITQLEQQDLLGTEYPYIHCTAALCDELPQKDGGVRANNIWGRGTAQIFGSVSPAMHDEFDTSYMVRFMEHFGLVYYGCCEPLHDKVHIMEKIPNLRKLSITPWAKVEPAAEAIGSKYVYAHKPNPAFVAETSFNADVVHKEITSVLTACKKNNCTCEFVLKDISTCSSRPENIFEWEKTVMETVMEFNY